MKLNLAKNTERLDFFRLIIVIYFTLTHKAVAAPENFNPELKTIPETETNEELTSKLSTQDNEAQETLRGSKSQVNIQSTSAESERSPSAAQTSLPSPTLNSESSLTAGTADIELKTDPNQERVNASDISILDIERLTLDFKLDFDNFGQTNQFIEETIAFNLYDQSLALKTGINTFEQDEVEKVDNIPLYLTWQKELLGIDLTLTGGVDFFDRLESVPTATLKASSPLFSSVNAEGKLNSLFVLSGQVQHQAYKFNAETLENEINFWRFTPSIYWQIRPNLSLFTLGQYGIFSDGNREFQSFSRLEQKIGAFSFAANLFTWAFEQDLGSINGYFSPADFLVYNGEIAWQGTMFNEFLDCKLSAAVGKQSVAGATDNAWSYKALCAAQLLPNVKLDLGYIFSNVRDSDTGDTSFNSQTIQGKLDIEL
ncbi:MAG: hypothetical protein AAF298_10185 [Cyanobacteria bacterium P01_A01_bin.40]